MAVEISGRVVNVLQQVTGQGKNGEWKKQEFIIETQSQYPKKIIFSLWGERTEQIRGLNPGEDVKVSFDPESREYNGRWYTDLRAWKVERGAATAQQPNSFNQEREYNPNQERSYTNINQPQPTTFSQPSGMMNDDLPF